MLEFPSSFPIPLFPESDSGSAKCDRIDSTISTTTDANYTITRPRATRKPQKWTFGYKAVSDEDYNTFDAFYQLVGMSEMFYFTPLVGPTAGERSTVRITAKGDWQRYFTGWQGTLTFQEV